MSDRARDEPDLLQDREQDRLDGLLRSTRTFHYLAFAAAAAGVGVAWHARRGVLEGKLPEWAVVIALLGVVTLTAVADRLFRHALPWIPLDPRRPPFPWVATGRGPGAEVSAIVTLLLPVILIGGAAAYFAGGGAERWNLLFAPTLLALVPRAIDHYFDAIVAESGAKRRSERFSSWLLHWMRLLQSCAFGLFLVCLMISSIPHWAASMIPTALVAMTCLVVSWSVGLAISLAFRPVDRYGARLGFLVWQSEVPAEQFVGKTVAHALKTFGVAAAALTLLDEPAGKLRQISFETPMDGEPVGVRLHLKYNAKRLFSAERKWDPAAVLEAEVERLEYIERRRGAPEVPRVRAVTGKIPIQPR